MSDKKRLLDLQDVSIVFGGLRAVSNLTMHIDEGELVGLIGPNGAGKTTAFNMITGVYLPTEGQIYFDKRTDFLDIGTKEHNIWKQQKQHVKTTSSFSPRNLAAFLNRRACCPP